MKKLILIDGNAILHRAYHSLPPFKTSKGETTNAIYGFLRMLIDIYKREKPEYLGIAWDRAAPTFRHEEFKEYKATRAAPPDDLYPQLPRLKQVLEAFKIPSLEMDGFEADDILGALSSQAEQQPDLQTVIVTGDRDAFQLVSEKTVVLAPVSGITNVIIYDPAKVTEKMGVRPNQIIDYKALCGDNSDNIKGVPGIGPKQACELLEKYQNLENIYAHLEELSPGQRKKLEIGRDSAIRSKRLVTIRLDTPIKFNLEDYHTHRIDFDKVKDFFIELEFNSLGSKLDELRAILEGAQLKNGNSLHSANLGGPPSQEDSGAHTNINPNSSVNSVPDRPKPVQTSLF